MTRERQETIFERATCFVCDVKTKRSCYVNTSYNRLRTVAACWTPHGTRNVNNSKDLFIAKEVWQCFPLRFSNSRITVNKRLNHIIRIYTSRIDLGRSFYETFLVKLVTLCTTLVERLLITSRSQRWNVIENNIIPCFFTH